MTSRFLPTVSRPRFAPGGPGGSADWDTLTSCLSCRMHLTGPLTPRVALDDTPDLLGEVGGGW